MLAIEGEPGFNELKVRGMYRGWRNLLTYGWFESGATFEGGAKNQLGMDGVIAFATRRWPLAARRSAYGFQDLCGHPYLRALALGDTFFCGERAMMMTRSSWDKEAMMLNMHTRQANGGHPFPDRSAIMVAGAGRIWSPNGYATFRTAENSVVGIDGKSQNEIVPARSVDFGQSPEASFMVGDAKYAWDWDWKRLENSAGYSLSPMWKRARSPSRRAGSR